MSLAENRYFKAGDIGVLAEKIEEFMRQPMSEDEKRRQIEMVRTKYDWDDIANKTLKIYERVLRAYHFNVSTAYPYE